MSILAIGTIPACGGEDVETPGGGSAETGGAAPAGCPDAAPELGSPCPELGLRCRYDAGAACPAFVGCGEHCMSGEPVWDGSSPDQGETCATPGQSCEYSRAIGDTCMIQKWSATCAEGGTFEVTESTENPCGAGGSG